MCIGTTAGISRFNRVITNEGLPSRCRLERGGPRTTQGLIVTILGPDSSFFPCHSLTILSELNLASPYGLFSMVASSAHVSVVRV
ncbi:MAG: hypothetical protein CXT66_07320 [Methanobacteriota archaeon]|nr:MAG: hypothetical protein CXT66_07320 [Euryarchaeota archaeon]